MTQAKHTQGPWVSAHREQHDGMYSTQVFTEDGETVATVAWYPKDNGCGVTSTYREANARLIAAAPELLEALQIARAYIASRCGTPDPEDRFADQALIQVHRLMDDAIAKATGTTQ